MGKTDILKFLGPCGQKKGYYVEYMYDPFVPERIEHIFIPEISTCVITNNEINKANYTGINYSLSDYTKPNSLSSKASEIEYDSQIFYELVNKAISLISNSHALHDDLEAFYIKAMNFDVVNNIYENVIRKIEKYE